MKEFICSACGSNNLLEKDGYLICQFCGTQHSVNSEHSNNISNYLIMAKSAYDAKNLKEAESYCNKIIELDSNNCEAWFLKGKTAGWQSTLAEIRIEEAINCFSKSIENAPGNISESLKSDAVKQIEDLSLSIFQLSCDLYAEIPDKSNALAIQTMVTRIRTYALMSWNKFKAKVDVPIVTIAKMINISIVLAYKQTCSNYLQFKGQQTEYIWNEYRTETLTAIDLEKYAISLLVKAKPTPEGDKQKIIIYKNLIVYLKDLRDSRSYKPSTYGWVIDRQYNAKAKEDFNNQIMAYHKQIKELDPDYVIPEPPKPSSGCYVATAVYGSYDCPQVWTLRRYRDYTLSETWYGRAFIRIYYAVSPTLVSLFGDTLWFRTMWRRPLDRMVAKLQSKGVKCTPYQDKSW